MFEYSGRILGFLHNNKRDTLHSIVYGNDFMLISHRCRSIAFVATIRTITCYLTFDRYLVRRSEVSKVNWKRNVWFICSPRDRIIEVGIYTLRICDLLLLAGERVCLVRIGFYLPASGGLR